MPQKTMSACYAFMDKQSVRVSSVKQKYSAILQHQQEQMEVSTTLQFSIHASARCQRAWCAKKISLPFYCLRQAVLRHRFQILRSYFKQLNEP